MTRRTTHDLMHIAAAVDELLSEERPEGVEVH